MKRILIVTIAVVALLFTSCRKEDNPKVPTLTRVQVPVLRLDASSDPFISPVNPAGFKAKFKAELLFESDGPPKSADIVVMKNNNKSTVKVVKPNVTTFPFDFEITGQDLITLFGPISGGDQFDIGVDITLSDGQKLLAFPETGDPYASGVVTLIGNVKPGTATSFQFLMPCPFNADAYNGDFVVVSDEWDDYTAGTVIPVTKVSATEISFKYNVKAGTAQPIVMKIDPATNAISVTRQYYGNYGNTPVWAESLPGQASTVNPCDVSLSLRLKHTDPSGSTEYGTATIKLKKK